ncbi:MAG: cobalamin-binding protein [Dehalococcoidia bacterium]|nr:cobalamin-binding protein [Dehalococcoidia bacterium]
MRICSLLPSATEIIFALGLGDQLVAVTHECDYPPEASRTPVITRSIIDHSNSSSREIHNHVASSVHSGSSIYALDQALLERLNPDVILTQELCEVCAVSYKDVQKAVRLLYGERNVVSLEPSSLGGILDNIRQVGALASVPERAARVTRRLQARIERVAAIAKNAVRKPKVLALEWYDPLFVGGHWVPEMIKIAGGMDGLGQEAMPSFIVKWDEVTNYDPDVIVLMPCGYHLEEAATEFRRTIIPEQGHTLRAARSGQVYVTDGSSYFNRPGPRTVDGLEIMAEILHPELFRRQKTMRDWRKL